MSGDLDMLQSFDVFRASDSALLPRDICEGCVCWRVFSTCRLVQVEDWEADRLTRDGGGYEGYTECILWRNCCPILFFDFIGVKLPVLKNDEELSSESGEPNESIKRRLSCKSLKSDG